MKRSWQSMFERLPSVTPFGSNTENHGRSPLGTEVEPQLVA